MVDYTYKLDLDEPVQMGSRFKQEPRKGIGVQPKKEEEPEADGWVDMFYGLLKGYFGDEDEAKKALTTEPEKPSYDMDDALQTLKSVNLPSRISEPVIEGAPEKPEMGSREPFELEVDTIGNEALDRNATRLVDVTDTEEGKLTNVKPLEELAEDIDPGTIDTSELPGKGLMSPRLDGKDGDLASYGDPFTVTEDELYKYATEAFPDNDLAAGALLATIEAESAGGDSMLESGNYTKEAALKVAYQGKYKTARKKEVEKIFKDPDLTYVDSDGNTRMTKEGQVKFFNIYYNDKYRGENYKMGNTEEGDGFRFRGRGPIQLTGKNNYKKYGDMIGVDLVQNPHLVVTDKDVALAVTKAYMKDKGLDKVTSASKLRNIVGHADDSSLTKAKARWKRAKEIENKIARSTSPRPMLRPDDFKVASN